jgi:hypothetical protein
MISKQVKRIMLQAMDALAKKKEVERAEIQLMVHARGNCNLNPNQIGIKYFHCTRGISQRDESGEIVYLDFIKDVLMEADLQNFSKLAADFFRKKLTFEAKANDIDIKNIEIAFVWRFVKELEKEELVIHLINNETRRPIKITTLESVFGEKKK